MFTENLYFLKLFNGANFHIKCSPQQYSIYKSVKEKRNLFVKIDGDQEYDFEKKPAEFFSGFLT